MIKREIKREKERAEPQTRVLLTVKFMVTSMKSPPKILLWEGSEITEIDFQFFSNYGD